MADCGGGNRGGDSGGLMVGLLAGTVIGAAGLGLWLLRQAEQRRLLTEPVGSGRSHRRHRFDQDFDEESTLVLEPPEGELHDKVQRLNHAIEDVRRQLETLGSEGTAPR